jgi:ribulose-phosphate 3-epimerase
MLSADFAFLARDVQALETGGADRLHVDVMDGRFVPNLSFGPPVFGALRAHTRLPFDVHLMTLEPDSLLEAVKEAGGTTVRVHAETCPHLHRTLQRIRDLGMGAGVALNPATPLSAVEEVAAELDVLLLMTVNPGFGGQAFIQASLEKIARARALLDACGSGAMLEVDGGVKASNAGKVVAAGARQLVAGSAVFSHAGGPAAALAELRAAALLPFSV